MTIPDTAACALEDLRGVYQTSAPTSSRRRPPGKPHEGSASLLNDIRSPSDLRAMPREQLRRVASEMRNCIVETVSRTGGHLSSNLGTVELAIALHFVLDTPRDRLIWDVGHQCYAHKILTGRRAAMGGLRTGGGISGFPRRSESPYDAFGTAHSSTSISAAMGMAAAARHRGEWRRVVAVIGDGALSAGMAFEALNNAATTAADLLIVLNDNEMSISPSLGGWHRHLRALAAELRDTTAATQTKGRLRSRPRHLAPAASTAHGPTSVFEEFGIDYHGPVDGHDVDALVSAIGDAVDRPGIRVLHVMTRKGHGYRPAELDPVAYHGVGRFDPNIGIKAAPTTSATSFTRVFGDWLCERASVDPSIVAITPAMIEGSGLARFAREFPDRCYDVGIAEQHAVTFAAGLACEGARPVVAIYSTFLQRAFDQFVHDVQLQSLPVLFAVDRGGLVGADGATHHGAFDLSYLRCIPNLTLMAPSTEDECRDMLDFGLKLKGPAVVRYPRGASNAVVGEAPGTTIELGRARILRTGHRIALLAFGPLVHAASDAALALDATVVDMRFVKPLDEELVTRLAATHELLVTLEDNVAAGGAGSAVLECLARRGSCTRVLVLGLPDSFIDHGDQMELLAALGLNSTGIVASVQRVLERCSALTGVERASSKDST